MLLNQILQYILIITALNAVTPVIAQRVLNAQILVVGGGTVSYTHLTLPTNREV